MGSIKRDMKGKDPSLPPPKSAVVLLSGGLCSTASLYWAITNRVSRIHCVSVWYGQEHHIELDAARAVIRLAQQHFPDVEISHEEIQIGPVFKGNSALLRDGDALPKYESSEDLSLIHI